jgi:hypothetical protein
VQLSITADTRELENRLYLLAKASRTLPGQVIKEEARFISENIIKLTPPKTKAQGRAKVKEDIGKVFTSLNYVMRYLKVVAGNPQMAIALKTLIQKGDFQGAIALINTAANTTETVSVKGHRRESYRVRAYTQTRTRVGTAVPYVSRSTAIVPSVDAAMHTGRRNERGRVTHSKLSGIILSKKSLTDYIKRVQDRVGWAKAGFVSALRASGGTAIDWYGRLAGAAGYATANFGENPGIYAVAHNIKIPGFQRVVDNTVKQREKITQRKIDRLLAGKATNLGFVTILEK